MKLIVLKYIAMGILALGLAGCGETEGDLLGNNSGSIIDGSGAPEPDIAGTVTGVISGFGSVFIDGVRYATDNTEVYIDGELKTEADLSLGDFITLFALAEGDDGEITAQTIYAESAVRGAITHIDTVMGQLTVLGQKVAINDDTFYGESTVAVDAFSIGDVIDIRGPSNNNGSVIATRIYPSEGRQESLRGVVGALNASESLFGMAGIEVHYAAVSELPDMLSEGLPVVVTGTFDNALQRFIARGIRQRNDSISHIKGVKVRTEGVANNVISKDATGSLMLGGQKIQVTGQTLFIKSDATPATFAELVDGQYIIVLGVTDAKGEVIAEKVMIKTAILKRAQAMLSGMIADITLTTPASVKKAATGEIVIDGVRVLIDERTRFVALGASFMKSRINFEDLGIGDMAIVRGSREYDGVDDSLSTEDIEGLSDSELVRLLEAKESSAADTAYVNEGLKKGGELPLAEGPITARIIELKRANSLEAEKRENPIKEKPRRPGSINQGQ